jgi:hypothetical protein
VDSIFLYNVRYFLVDDGKEISILAQGSFGESKKRVKRRIKLGA